MAGSMNEEMLKAELEAGLSALKGSMIINGGAAGALLAVLAEGLKSSSPTALSGLLQTLAWGWLFFMLGLGAAGVAMAFRYFSQRAYTGDRIADGDGWRSAATWTAMISFVLFFAGAIAVFLVVMARSA